MSWEIQIHCRTTTNLFRVIHELKEEEDMIGNCNEIGPSVSVHTCRLQGVKRLQLHIINQRGGRSWALGKSHVGLQLGFIRVIQLCQCSLQDASILGWEMFTIAFHQGNTTPDRD